MRPISVMFPSLCNFASAHESSPKPFKQCLPKGRERHLPTCQHVKDCSHRPCYSHSISDSDVYLREISEM